MTSGEAAERDLVTLVVDSVGAVVETDVIWEPYRLLDPCGDVVASVTQFLHELQASGRSASTQRSYALDLLRWFRFLWAVEVPWGLATRCEARDFCRWLALVDKPRRGTAPQQAGGVSNAVTGKRSPGRKYAASTLARSETVLRSFYAFHLEAGAGPIINPFPLVRERAGSRAHAHLNPMEPFPTERSGRFRPRVGARIPRRIPDERFNQVFAQLRCDRDRALVAFWVSTGARTAELLGARGGDVDPGQQLITVVRKGSRAVQQLPASADAFVWLRLYQVSLGAQVPSGADDPLRWANRKPLRELTYHAARALFTRANQVDGSINKKIVKITRAELIVVDDIGMLPSGQQAAEAFYHLVDAAYERRSLAVTSNLHPAGFDTIMPPRHRSRRPTPAPCPRHHHRRHLTTPRRGHRRTRGDPPDLT